MVYMVAIKNNKTTWHVYICVVYSNNKQVIKSIHMSERHATNQFILNIVFNFSIFYLLVK